MDKDFETSWKEFFQKSRDKRNSIVALIALITGTVLILPDVLLTDSYPTHLLYLRIGASAIGFLGFILYKLKKIENGVMVLSYALPVFIVTPYMISTLENLTAVTQQNNTLAVVGIFFIAIFVLKSNEWIIMCSVLYLSYFLFLYFQGNFPFTVYLTHGGSLVLIGFFTFPFITRVKNRMMKENHKLNYEVESQKEELEYYANNDLLTGAFNRRGGMKILKQLILMTQRHQIPLSICFIDINGLKEVNDKEGHDAGDRLIQTVASRFLDNIRKSDSLFRFGGDEFIAVFPGCNLEESEIILNKITDKSLFSFGLAEYKENMTEEEFIKAADQSMYRNKQEKPDND